MNLVNCHQASYRDLPQTFLCDKRNHDFNSRGCIAGCKHLQISLACMLEVPSMFELWVCTVMSLQFRCKLMDILFIFWHGKHAIVVQTMLDQLQRDVKDSILELLTTTEQLQCMLVCKVWQEAVRDQHDLRVISMETTEERLEGALQWLRDLDVRTYLAVHNMALTVKLTRVLAEEQSNIGELLSSNLNNQSLGIALKSKSECQDCNC